MVADAGLQEVEVIDALVYEQALQSAAMDRSSADMQLHLLSCRVQDLEGINCSQAPSQQRACSSTQ